MYFTSVLLLGIVAHRRTASGEIDSGRKIFLRPSQRTRFR